MFAFYQFDTKQRLTQEELAALNSTPAPNGAITFFSQLHSLWVQTVAFVLLALCTL